MERRRFVQIGILAFSYFLINGCKTSYLPWGTNTELEELSKLIPVYYFAGNYLDSKVKYIQTLLKEDGVTDSFIFISDIHWENNTRFSPLLMRYIQINTNISKVFCGGDISDGCNEDGFNYISLLKTLWHGDIHCVVGNHEYLVNPNVSEELVCELFKTNPAIQHGNRLGHYYYIDNSRNKLRYVVLSAFSHCLDNKYHVEFVYGDEQKEWLKKVALDVRDGWSIIIFTHYLYNIGTNDNKIYIADKSIETILDDYRGRGRIIALFQGHNHRDRVSYLGHSPIPVITTTCDKYRILGSDKQNVERTPGTIDEQAFDVVIINSKQGLIHCVRIGCPAKDGIGDEEGNNTEERIIKF